MIGGIGIFIIAIALVLSFVSLAVCVDMCKQTGPCSCTNSKGHIDLSPLALDNGQPEFKDKDDNIHFDQFSWNPCFSFTEDKCTNVAACHILKTIPPVTISIGTQDSAKFLTAENDEVSIEYTAVTDIIRTTTVILTCDESTDANLIVTGEIPIQSGKYFMELKSKYSCPRSGQLSPGSIILIIAVAMLASYVIVGVVFQRFVRKADGRALFPNYAFWAKMPGYVKEGALFIFRRDRKSYESI